MNSFAQYSDVLLDGFTSNTKSLEVISKKHNILQDVLTYHDLQKDNILFVGFSPWCLGMGTIPFKIAEVSDRVLAYLDNQGCQFQVQSLSDLTPLRKSASIVVATDEYFTFSDSDVGQRMLVNCLAEVAKDVIVTTLRDYKNQDFKDREFSQPVLIRNSSQRKIYLEHYDYDTKDKNASMSRTYVFDGDVNSMHGPFSRRNMYFKQLAKFSIDAGARNFYVHKNLMYKSVIKKNYEHVITIKF